MAGAGAGMCCGVLKEAWWQSIRGLLGLMADEERFEAARLAASCLVGERAGDETYRSWGRL